MSTVNGEACSSDGSGPTALPLRSRPRPGRGPHDPVRRFSTDALEWEKGVLARKRGVAGNEHRALLAELLEREMHGEERA